MSEDLNAGPSAEKTSSKPVTTRKRRRWLWIIGGIFAALILLVALLPTILSLGPMRRLVLGIASSKINGKIQADSWSLGWFSGLWCRNLQVLDAEGNFVVGVKSVVVPAVVPSLLGSKIKLGTISVEALQANVVVYPDGTTNLQKLFPLKPKKEKVESPSKTDVRVKLAVHDGEVSVRPSNAVTPFVVRNLMVDADVPGLKEQIRFAVSAMLGEEHAPLTVSGHARLPQPGAASTMPAADVVIGLKDFNLAGVSALAKQFGAPVDLSGKTTVNIRAETEATGDMKTSGQIALSNLVLSGGPIASDKVNMERADLQFDVAKSGDKVSISKFQLDSPLANAEASGLLTLPKAGQLPAGDFKAAARVDLARLAAQLPNTLKLQKGMVVERGTLTLDAVVSGTETQATELSLAVNDLAATIEGRKIAPDAPIRLTAKAVNTQAGLRIEAFNLESSFATAQGNGDLKDFRFALNSDLSAAMREAGKFIDITGRDAKGTATLELRLRETEPLRRKVEVTFGLKNLDVVGFMKERVRMDAVAATLDCLALFDASNKPTSVQDLVLDVRSPVATAGFTASRIILNPTGLPKLEGGKLTADADMGNLMLLAERLAAPPAGMNLKGTVHVGCGISLAQGVLTADILEETGLSNLDFSMTGTVPGKTEMVVKHFREPKISLAGRATADINKRSANVNDLTCNLSFGQLKVVQAGVPDWSKAPAGASARVTGDFAVETLLASAKDFVTLPAGTDVRGKLGFTLTATGVADTEKVTLEALVEALSIKAANAPPIENERVGMNFVADIAPMPGNAQLESLVVKSAFANITATGSLMDWKQAMRLRADGQLDLNFGRIGPLVAALTGEPIELSGQSARPFSIDTALGGKDVRALVRATIASLGTHIDRVKFSGIEATDIEIPAGSKDGRVWTKIEAKLNGGTVSLPVQVDATGEEVALTLPPNTVLFSQADISDALADQVLARVSPIFKKATVAAGKASFISNELYSPLSVQYKQKATMTGALKLQGVQFASAGFLLQVFDAMKLQNARIFLPDQDVKITLRNGIIHQAPLTIQSGKYTLLLSGNIGLDNTLNMVLEVPITEEMVGSRKEVYDLIKNQTIRVKVTGTTSSPAISKDIIQENATHLIESAAKELFKKKGADILKGGLKDIFK